MDDPGEPLNQSDVLIHASEVGQETRAESEGQVASLIDEMIGGQHHGPVKKIQQKFTFVI